MKLLDEIKGNWKSGVTVALVSIPLSFSLAIASGASPMTGIITATWAGLMAGIFGGSSFNIVGPAGALAGILVGYAMMYGAGILPILAILSGVVIFIIWLLGWDKYLVFVPSSVIHGFTLGVALTIGLGQVNSAFGLSGLPSHENAFANLLESIQNMDALNLSAFIPFLVGLGMLFFFLKVRPLWPGSIILAILGIIFGYLSIHEHIPFVFQTVGTKYPNLSGNLFAFPSISDLLTNEAFSKLSRFSQILNLAKFSIVIGFVALLETLISAKTADGMSKTKFNQKKETLGVAIANVVSGIFGGLPASGVFARTALNVKSGAKSNYSQIINALSVGIISVIFISGFNYLPLSITASILVFAAIRMVAAEHFKKLFKFDKTTFGLSIAVAGLTYGVDATAGILVGTLAALLVSANKLANNNLGSESDPENFNPEENRDKAIIYRIAGPLTYFNAKSHLERIANLPNNKPVVFNLRHMNYIDVDGFEAMEEILETLHEKNIPVYITGVRPEMLKGFKEHKSFRELLNEKRVLNTTKETVNCIN
ncbi:MAG: SulP family inorganic anion transporter [Minisyncoccia bacterium]